MDDRHPDRLWITEQERLAYKGCGQPAADEFCRFSGVAFPSIFCTADQDWAWVCQWKKARSYDTYTGYDYCNRTFSTEAVCSGMRDKIEPGSCQTLAKPFHHQGRTWEKTKCTYLIDVCCE